ncbi:MFS-type transporter SLC18B1-like isoform X4 [Rhopilema esculentum]|uniref:MFS-type transporter SLC18B1-like isoform X4 n=1 Tax=Rhopilema esculentum TaxID=499914 RepID=UPI0031DC2858
MLSQSNNEYRKSKNFEREALIPTSKNGSREELSEMEESPWKKVTENVDKNKIPCAKWKKTTILVCLSLQWFLSLCSFSMIAPFFPQEADSKGVSMTTSSLVFTTFALVSVICSPLIGALGVLETFAGFGLMAGPPIGGLLYRAGGFELPFLVVGSITLLTFFPFYFILPAMKIEKDPKDGNMKLIQAMKIPVVFFMGIITICTGMVLSFLDPIFQRHLNNTFHLGTVKVGLVFLIWGAAYAISAPALGTLAEKTDTRYAICSGAIIYGLSFPLLGPPPFISAIPSALWLNCVALAIAGLGLALYMVPALSDMYKSATRYGMSADLSTQSALASIFNSALHTGMAIGASLSGLLVQHFSFAWATTIFGIFQTIVGLMVFAFTFCERRSASYLRTKIKDKREIEKRPI